MSYLLGISLVKRIVGMDSTFASFEPNFQETLSPFLIIFLNTNMCTCITLEDYLPLKPNVITRELPHLCINDQLSFVYYWNSSWKAVSKCSGHFCFVFGEFFCWYVHSVGTIIVRPLALSYSLWAFIYVLQSRMRIDRSEWVFWQSPHVTKAEAVEKKPTIPVSERKNPTAQLRKIQPGKHQMISSAFPNSLLAKLFL